MRGKQPVNLNNYKSSFEKLHQITYRDIRINHLAVRILGIHFMPYIPGWNIRKHKHSFFEFHYVTEYSTFTSIHNKESEIKAGHFYILPPGTFHSHRQASGTGHVGFALRWEFLYEKTADGRRAFPARELDSLADTLTNSHAYPVKDKGTVIRAMKRLLDLSGDTNSALELQLEFFRLLSQISSYYRTTKPESLTPAGSADSENHAVRNTLRFIDENYAAKMEVGDIARHVYLSYSHLSRLFKKHTGETINEYINRVRLFKAQHLLACTSKSVELVARETGFSSEYYFSSAFKKYFGVSPSAYRSSKLRLSE